MTTFSRAPRFGPNTDIDRTGGQRHSKAAHKEHVSQLMLDPEALHHARKLSPALTPAQEKTYVRRFLGLIGARPVNSEGPIHFGQKSVNPKFSKNMGDSQGLTIHSQADALRAESVSTDKFPVTYAAVDRSRVTMNNRSLTTLSMAKKKPSIVNDATGKLPPSGDDSAAALLERLHETGTVHQREMPVRDGKAREMTGREERVSVQNFIF